MPYVMIGESRHYYEVYGEGVPVILGHGVAGNHASWFNQVPSLSKSYKTIVFEHRGFGNSEDVEGLGRSAYVDDAEAFLDALRIDRAVFVGQSLCGGTFAGLACTKPHRVRALVLADTMVSMVRPEDLRAEIEAVETATHGLSQSERVLGPVIRREQPELAFLYLQLATFNSVTIKTLKGTPLLWSIEQLAATGIPTMFIVGEDDVLCPPPLVEALHRRVPGSHFALILRSGHSAYFEQPAQFNARLLEFLSVVTRSDGA
jgi:3-oxoadipate enol-lactonase